MRSGVRSFLPVVLCAAALSAAAGVRTGADILIGRRLDLVRGRNIGLVTNNTGRLSTGERLLDALLQNNISVRRIFAPEHGMQGTAAAGEAVRDSADRKTGIPIVSLYGRTAKPPAESLRGLDMLVYDLQDVGVRWYTYISTMGLVMEAAAGAGIPIVVLDRPDPVGRIAPDGPVIEDTLRSFVGMYAVPVVYGLTCGELARMINGEGWLAHGAHADLTVIPMEGWERSMPWEKTGLAWTPPSPNIPTLASAYAYASTCLLEATNVSEGRGTPRPFETIGAPFLDGTQLADALNSAGLGGVRFSPVSFVPSSSKYRGQECHGVSVVVTSPDSFRPVLAGLHILRAIRSQAGPSWKADGRALDRLLGMTAVRRALFLGADPAALEGSWRRDILKFTSRSAKYTIY